MKKAMVFGAGVSGNGALKLLQDIGYDAILVDDKIAMKSSDALNILPEVSLFVKSPGIPYVELVKRAVELGIEVIDEIELGYRELKKRSSNTKIVAITGTNGKTTTTSKIAEIINMSGLKGVACGNIGKSFAEVVLENNSLDWIVLECSSYQLENIKEFKADIAMVINLTPDHLDRYSSPDEYYDVKFNITKNQKEEDFFIFNLDDIEIKKRENLIKGKKVNISKNDIPSLEKGTYIKNEILYYNDQELLQVEKFALKGQHNLENMLFIVTVAKLIGISDKVIEDFSYSTKSLEHRLEDFLKVENTIFINDSKGTNIDSTKFAVEAFNKPILICGGKDKKFDLAPLAKIIKEDVKEVLLIGENRNLIINELEKINYSRDLIHNLETIENCAKFLKEKLNLEEKNVILFSPATSSFDQFKNFEDRGEKFKSVIREYFGG